MAHHSGSVNIWPIIGLKPYDTLLSIQTNMLHHTRINFMRSSRCCTCLMRTCTSILPPYGSHVLTSPCNFVPTATLVQGLWLCLGRPGHSGTSITLYVAGCWVFYLGYNYLKGKNDQRIWEICNITEMAWPASDYCWFWQGQVGYQVENWFWNEDFCYTGNHWIG